MIRARALLVVTLALATTVIAAAPAGATTVTRQQNPHYRVTASLTPTTVARRGTLTLGLSVTNTSDRARTVSISWEYDWSAGGAAGGEGTASSPITIPAHATWSRTLHRTARNSAARYTLTLRASDRLGTSHATATAHSD